MASNSQKTPLARTLEHWGTNKALAMIALTGKSLPAEVVNVVSSGIVTIKFLIATTPNSPYTLPKVTVPILGSEYVRLPIQDGCLGLAVAADAYLGGVSGLGGGVADLSRRGNLTCLSFAPTGSKMWTPSEDPNSLVLYGPDGVVVRDANKKTTMTLTVNGVVFTLQAGDAVTINGNLIVDGNLQLSGNIQNQTGATYGGNIATTGNVVANVGPNQVGLATHTHDQPNDSHGDTEQPTSSPNAGT